MPPDHTTQADRDAASVSWERVSTSQLPPPLILDVPYVEVKLEHPDLDATRFGESFFPSAVPYSLDAEDRVFCWRSTLAGADPSPGEWDGITGTTHGMDGLRKDDRVSPPLWSSRDDEVEVVVSGTIAGSSTTAGLDAYDAPDISLSLEPSGGITCHLDDAERVVRPGSRISHPFGSRTVRIRRDDEPRTITPTLHVRYPGDRVFYHPAPGADYALFPSFGLDLDTLPRPITVPTTYDELDHGSLARRLDVDLASRPYPERVLWQAFAYAAFDPKRPTPPRLSQLETGHITVKNPQLTRHA